MRIGGGADQHCIHLSMFDDRHGIIGHERDTHFASKFTSSIGRIHGGYHFGIFEVIGNILQVDPTYASDSQQSEFHHDLLNLIRTSALQVSAIVV
jgi:hypothetical protein